MRGSCLEADLQGAWPLPAARVSCSALRPAREMKSRRAKRAGARSHNRAQSPSGNLAMATLLDVCSAMLPHLWPSDRAALALVSRALRDAVFSCSTSVRLTVAVDEEAHKQAPAHATPALDAGKNLLLASDKALLTLEAASCPHLWIECRSLTPTHAWARRLLASIMYLANLCHLTLWVSWTPDSCHSQVHDDASARVSRCPCAPLLPDAAQKLDLEALIPEQVAVACRSLAALTLRHCNVRRTPGPKCATCGCPLAASPTPRSKKLDPAASCALAHPQHPQCASRYPHDYIIKAACARCAALYTPPPPQVAAPRLTMRTRAHDRAPPCGSPRLVTSATCPLCDAAGTQVAPPGPA